MTAAPPAAATPQQPDRDNSAFAIPLIVWLLIQLAAVALAASGVELSANFPRPARSMAVHEMLVAQFVGSAMFFHVLFRGGWRGWLAVIVSAALMLVLAAWLARTPMARVPGPWVHVAVWLTMLALWSKVGRRTESRGYSATVTAVAMLLSAGGSLFWYLNAEFQGDRAAGWLHLFPLPALLTDLASPSTSLLLLPLLPTATLAVAALVILAATASSRRADQQFSDRQTTQPATEK